MAWQPLQFGNITQGLVPLSKIPIGGTFMYLSEFWRRFEGGVRRQKGGPPKVLKQLPLDTEVWAVK